MTRKERAERERQFREALDRGDVVEAITITPRGYRSRMVPGGYHFKWDGGREGFGLTMLDAVRMATDGEPV